VRELPDEAAKLADIDGITARDVFRSQFRSERDAPRSPVEIIKWGLEHLDRLRKVHSEASDASAKRWQMWLVFWVGIAGIAAQVVIAYGKAVGWFK
jgi:hypothetical protein